MYGFIDVYKTACDRKCYLMRCDREQPFHLDPREAAMLTGHDLSFLELQNDSSKRDRAARVE
jgi:hypothetical protein